MANKIRYLLVRVDPDPTISEDAVTEITKQCVEKINNIQCVEKINNMGMTINATTMLNVEDMARVDRAEGVPVIYFP